MRIKPIIIYYIGVMILYAFSFIQYKKITIISLIELMKVLRSLFIPLIIVFIFLLILETPKGKKMLKKAITSKYSAILFIFAGVLSVGSIYVIYPILYELKKKGVSYAHISAFLYARAIKLPLLPLLAYYFSLTYAIVFTLTLFIFSFVVYIVTKFVERWFYENSNSFR